MIDKIDIDKCIGCGLCVEICCMDVFRLETTVSAIKKDAKNRPTRKTKAKITYRDDCMTCYNCELKCPTGAIDVGYSPPVKPYII